MSKDGIKEINPRDLDTKGTNLQYRGAGKALRGQGNVLKVKPTLGKYYTKEYLRENKRKIDQAKVRLESMKKVDADVKKGYESVKTKFKDTGLKQKVDKILNKKPFKGD